MQVFGKFSSRYTHAFCLVFIRAFESVKLLELKQLVLVWEHTKTSKSIRRLAVDQSDLNTASPVPILIEWHVIKADLKGNLRSKHKLSSNEKRVKNAKNEPSLTSIHQIVLEISHPKVRNLSKMEVIILLIFSLILT